MSNHLLSLDRDALYIETQSQTEEGKYHWALLFVDASGGITRHHWAEPPPISPRASPTQRTAHASTSAELYGRESIPAIAATMRPGTALLLGYCKVSGYRGGLTNSMLDEVCSSTFKGSYPTVELNRAHGLNCRTWLLKVLGTLQERGLVVKGTPVAELEKQVCNISREADFRRLEAFLRSMTYKIFVSVV